MKKLTILALLLATLTGCSLIPKRVEFFQDKVKAVPTVTDTALEHQRQAAQFVDKQIEVAKIAAAKTDADPTVTAPLNDASIVQDALTEVLGPADDPLWLKFIASSNVAPTYAKELRHDQAKLNAKVKDYAADVQKDVGKKIEGTGLIQMSYFTYVGLLIGVILLIWFGLKVYGMVNPAVGLGVNTVTSVGSSVLSKGFSELVAGGEQFKDYVEKSPLTAEVKEYVQDLFVRAHTSNQSADVQQVVTQLTAQTQPGIAPVVPPAPSPTTVQVLAPLNTAPKT